MKYIRKIVALGVGLIFFVALVISLGMIFAVKNINVTMVTYAEDCTESYEVAKQSFEAFKGESILFFDEKDVAEIVKDSNYTLAECKKIYPCTINITLKERLETFAVSVGGMYSMYDSDGRHLRNSADNNNINDGTPNVELLSVPINSIENIAAIASTFKTTFGGLRSIVSSINIEDNPEVENYTKRLYFNLRCGLKVQILDYDSDIGEKISAAYRTFVTLTDREKLSGTIRCQRVGGDEGVIEANYHNL